VAAGAAYIHIMLNHTKVVQHNVYISTGFYFQTCRNRSNAMSGFLLFRNPLHGAGYQVVEGLYAQQEMLFPRIFDVDMG